MGRWIRRLAHRNRSDFCDLRLRCPSRTPEIAAISETRENNPILPFLVFFGKGKENPPEKQGFLIPTERVKSLEKKGKTLKETRKSSQGEKTRKSKKTRKGRTGNAALRFKGAMESR